MVAIQFNKTLSLMVAPEGDFTKAKEIPALKNNFFAKVRGLTADSSGRIIYALITGENWDIWVTEPDGSKQTRLTTDEHADKFPAFRLTILESPLSPTAQAQTKCG